MKKYRIVFFIVIVGCITCLLAGSKRVYDYFSWDEETTTWTSSDGDNNVMMDLGGDAGNFGFTKITVTYK